MTDWTKWTTSELKEQYVDYYRYGVAILEQQQRLSPLGKTRARRLAINKFNSMKAIHRELLSRGE